MGIIRELYGLFIIGIWFLALFALGEILYYFVKLKGDNTRKIIHAITGLLALLFPMYLHHWVSVGLLCGSFLVILFFTKRLNLLSSINDVSRESQGSVLYPIVVFFVYCVYTNLNSHYPNIMSINFYYLPIAILGLADPAASFVGQKYGNHPITFVSNKKSWEGSLACALVAFLISLVLLQNLGTSQIHVIVLSLTIGIGAAIGEMFGKNGWDNVTVPVVVMFVYGAYQLI